MKKQIDLTSAKNIAEAIKCGTQGLTRNENESYVTVTLNWLTVFPPQTISTSNNPSAPDMTVPFFWWGKLSEG